MNAPLIAINELNPIAQRLREREEEIGQKKHNVFAHIAELTALAADQGRDLILAKTKLGKHLRWSEWLKAHVPNLPEQQAGKYERIATEQLTDPRQCVFAFLPPIDKQAPEQKADPKPWEQVWGYMHSIQKRIRDTPPNKWPPNQFELGKDELNTLAKAFGCTLTPIK